MSDLISRQAAIDAECEVCRIAPKKERGHNCTYYVHGCKEIECLRALPSAQPEIVRCKDCKYFEYDHPCMIQGVPVLGHLVCIKWGNGCRTDEDGFCFMGERKDG